MPNLLRARVATDERYRLRRLGRDEWLDDTADPTDDATRAAVFASATEACIFCLTHVDQPHLWIFEPCPR